MRRDETLEKAREIVTLLAESRRDTGYSIAMTNTLDKLLEDFLRLDKPDEPKREKFVQKVYGLNDKLVFGKYSGQTIKNVLTVNPSYIRWAVNNVNGFTLNDEACAVLDARSPVRITPIYYDDEHWDGYEYDDWGESSWR